MSRYNINTIRLRLKAFDTARRSETILPTSVMPPHVCLANEIADEFSGCELSEDIEDVWDVLHGEIDWKHEDPPTCYLGDDYYFPVLKNWAKGVVLNYSDSLGLFSLSLTFTKTAIDFVFTLFRTFPYADPDFEANVDTFLRSGLPVDAESEVERGRYHQMKLGIESHVSWPTFGDMPIAASLSQLFLSRHEQFQLRHQGTKESLLGSSGLYFWDDPIDQLMADISDEDDDLGEFENLAKWGSRSMLEYNSPSTKVTAVFDDPTASCICTREVRGSIETTRRAVAVQLGEWSLSIPVYRHENTALFSCDCRHILRGLDESPNFLFADPPFNIGHGYDGYDDNLSDGDYCQFTKEWIHAAEECLADDGLLAVHVPDDVVPLVLASVRLTRIAWIIWHYRFGQCGRTNWINSKAHCLVFAKNPSRYTWNPDDVLVSSDRASTYKDKRTLQSATPGQRVPFDVWGIPSDGPNWGRVQGNNAERRPGHPNQLPEVYLERLIRAYTNPGDLVLDPFVGSGTSVVVAEALGRRSIGIDISLSNIDSAYERVRNGAVRAPS